MTREEAIQIISDIDKAYRNYTADEYKALEMAIQALSSWGKYSDKLWKEAYERGKTEALSQEPCDDAISRKDIQDYIAKYLSQYLYEDVRQAVEVIDAYIGDMPSVTQTPKYWIDKDSKIYKMPDDIPTMTIQYPTITHGDTISRTEVMKVISDFVTFEKYIDKHNHITFEPLEKMINALPSVTVRQTEAYIDGIHAMGYREGYKDAQKQKSGKWVAIDEEPHEDYECSCCGYVVSTFTANIEPHTEYKFCPNCGACMKDGRTLDEFIEDSKESEDNE